MAVIADGFSYGVWGAYNAYGHLNGTISRSGNTVTLSNLTFYLTFSGPCYASGYSNITYIQKGDSVVSTDTWWQWAGSQYTSNTVGLNNFSFVVGTTDTSATVNMYNNEGDAGSFTVNFPSGGTPPSGLSASNIVPMKNGFSATITLESWGSGGSAATRYRELQVRTYSSISPRRYQRAYGNDLTGTIICDNNSTDDGGLTIIPNTRYTLSMYATNGETSIGSTKVGDYVTLPEGLASISAAPASTTSATVSYTTGADGGYYSKKIQYFIEGVSSSWTTGATISSGSETSGTFTITGLTPNAVNTIRIRVNTTAGNTDCDPIVVALGALPVSKFYGSVNSKTSLMRKMYGSKSDVTSPVVALYGSYNGETKLVWGHVPYYDYGTLFYRDGTAIREYKFKSVADFNKIYNSLSSLGSIEFDELTVAKPNILGVDFGDYRPDTIEEYFLAYCTGLDREVKLPGSVTAIKAHFMHGDTAYDYPLVLPPKLKTIGGYFMYDCISFSHELEIPYTVTSTGNYFMYNCNDFIGPLTVPAGATPYPSSNFVLSTSSSSSQMYTVGITVTGSGASTWKNAYPNRTTAPYRKLR